MLKELHPKEPYQSVYSHVCSIMYVGKYIVIMHILLVLKNKYWYLHLQYFLGTSVDVLPALFDFTWR